MAANKNNPATERQIVEQTGLTTIPGLPTPAPTPTPATEQQIAEQTGLTNILGLPNPGSVPVSTPESPSSSTRPPRPPRTGGTRTSNTNNTNEITNPSSENAYYDIINAMGQKPEMPQSTDKSAGAGAAEGTQYSWDKQGMDVAQNQYQQEVLKAKQDALANRQTIEQNALQYQQQADMMKYANNQNAEKVGWTGGYVLDQNRQMEYLKSSIQAQMYGAMELQKYGYDSALAAARLSYDLNQKEFAHKYYQDAVNVAVTEAQLTGTYFSAETRDMMSQYSAANQELGDLKDKSIEEIDEGIANGSISLTPEQTRAHEVKKNIESWYSANGVTKTGIKTLAAWQAESTMMREWANTQWELYQSALSAAENKLDNNVNAFIKVDEKGNPMYNGTSVETGDWNTMSGDAIAEYLLNDNGTINNQRQQQLFSYMDTQLSGQISSGFNKYCEVNGITPDNYQDEMLNYLNSSDALSKFLSTKFSNVSNANASTIINNLNGYTADITLPDGTEFTYKLEASTNSNISGPSNKPEENQDSKADGKLPTEPMIKDTYTDGKELVKTLATNKEFEDLSATLNTIDWSEDPMNWFDDPNNGWGQFIKFNLTGPNGGLVDQIQSAIKQKDYKEFGNALQQTKDTIIVQIGEDNYKLLQKTYNEYINMSDRDKALLSTKEKEYYEKITEFAEGIQKMDAAIEYCRNNDSNIITNGWNYVGDNWRNVGKEWTEVNGVRDVILATGSTMTAVVNTVVGGVTGFFRWVFTGKGASNK